MLVNTFVLFFQGTHGETLTFCPAEPVPISVFKLSLCRSIEFDLSKEQIHHIYLHPHLSEVNYRDA